VIYIIPTSVLAVQLATALILERSAWFMVTPLPADQFLFEVKREHGEWVENWRQEHTK